MSQQKKKNSFHISLNFFIKYLEETREKNSKINIKIYISQGKKANLKKNTDTICDSRSAAEKKKQKRKEKYIMLISTYSPMYRLYIHNTQF